MQATVQAALALSPRDAVNAAYQANSVEGVRYGGYATDALTIAVFEILIAGTLGTLLIRFFAPRLLDKVQRLLHSYTILLCMPLCQSVFGDSKDPDFEGQMKSSQLSRGPTLSFHTECTH